METNEQMNTPSTPVYVLTGATGAMGKVIAKNLALKGKPLVIASRDIEAAQLLAGELITTTRNNDITCLRLDLSTFADVKAFVAQLKELNRPVAALINNAAILLRRRQLGPDGYERTIQVNFLSTVLLSQLVVPLMGESGKIVMTTSMMRNFTSLPYEFPAVNNFVPLTTFAQSKLALTLFSIYLSTTLRTRRVSVNCADPGLINSGMLALSHWYDKLVDRVGRGNLVHSPEEGALAVMRALESSDTGFIFKGNDSQVKTSSLLKNREVFIKLCNDTMRILKPHLQ